MQTYLLFAFVAVSVAPIVLLATVQAVSEAERREKEARGRVQEAATAIQQEVEQYLGDNRSAVAALARLLERTGADTRLQALERHHELYPAFFTMLVTDRDGLVIATDARPAGGLLEKRRSVADREYFRAARDTGRPYVSDVFEGRTLGADPIVAISAPYFDRLARFQGVVEGSLDLRRLAHFQERYRALEAGDIILLDGKDQVVYASTSTGLRPLTVRTGSPMLLAASAARDPASFYFERTVDGRPVEYLASQQALETVPWRVFVRQPVRVLRATTRRYYLFTLWWSLGAIALSFLLARAAARRVTQPLARLADAVRAFRLTGEGPAPPPSAGAPAEVADLVQGFDDMQARLGRTLQGLLPICASCKKIRDEQGRWDHVESYIRQRSQADFTHGICPECARRLYPDDYKK